jgi:quercetin dioxygenase-like cupin family protein
MTPKMRRSRASASRSAKGHRATPHSKLLDMPEPSELRQGHHIDHADIPIVASPSGLPTQHLVSARDGAQELFVAQQWLQPGDRVLLHTHPVEEAITFLSGSGEATLGEETVPIGAGVSLYIPADVVHGFRCIEGTLHVMVVFPVPEFAETTIVEPEWSGVE